MSEVYAAYEPDAVELADGTYGGALTRRDLRNHIVRIRLLR